MPAIKYIEGDLFKAVSDHKGSETIIIPHVCNSKGAFGAGFVIPLAKAFPETRENFLAWTRIYENNELTFHTGPYCLGHVQFIKVKPKIVVANMVAQTLGGNRPLSYKYLGVCMERVSLFCDSINVPRIVAPMFGSGLAKGTWGFIEQLIEDHWGNMEIQIHYLPQFLPKDWKLPYSGIHTFEKRP